jgi:hypothetical protein
MLKAETMNEIVCSNIFKVHMCSKRKFLVKGVIFRIGRLLSFDPVINPISNNLPVGY